MLATLAFVDAATMTPCFLDFAHDQTLLPSLISSHIRQNSAALSKATDEMKTPTRSRQSVLRPITPSPPPVYSPKPGFKRPRQPPSRPTSSSSFKTSLTKRTFRLDGISPVLQPRPPSRLPRRRSSRFCSKPKRQHLHFHEVSENRASGSVDAELLSRRSIYVFGIESQVRAEWMLRGHRRLRGDDVEDVFGSSQNKEPLCGFLVSFEKAGAKGKKFAKYVFLDD